MWKSLRLVPEIFKRKEKKRKENKERKEEKRKGRKIVFVVPGLGGSERKIRLLCLSLQILPNRKES